MTQGTQTAENRPDLDRNQLERSLRAGKLVRNVREAGSADLLIKDFQRNLKSSNNYYMYVMISVVTVRARSKGAGAPWSPGSASSGQYLLTYLLHDKGVRAHDRETHTVLHTQRRGRVALSARDL